MLEFKISGKEKDEKMNKIFLTSAITLAMAMPAMAADTPTNITSTFPNATNGQYMQADYRYTNAATSDNMDNVYADNATVYALSMWSGDPGYYASGDSQVLCPAGSYCDGATRMSCGTSYTSDAGTGDQSYCYMNCSDGASANSHATYIGRVYYSSGTPNVGGNYSTCSIVSCENGWHLVEGTAVNTGYSVPSSSDYAAYAWVDADGNFNNGGRSTWQSGTAQTSAGIYAPNTFAYSPDGTHGLVKGRAQCFNISGQNSSGLEQYGRKEISGVATFVNMDSVSAGQYCYCKFETEGSTFTHIPARWVFNQDLSSTGECQAQCAQTCANSLAGIGTVPTGFQAAMAGSGLALNSCVANTINVTWQDAATGTIRATSFTYGGNIDTPSVAPTKTGKTFLGWKFSSKAN